MALNNMIPQYRSPVATYSALRQQRDNQASNAVNMLAKGQDMRAQQQKMNLLQSAENREIDQQKLEGMAAVGKYLDQFRTTQEKKAAFDAVRGQMDQYGLPAVPPEVGYEQVAPALEQAKMQVYGEPESPFSQINPSQYTPQSVGQFEKTGQYGDLVGLEKKGVTQNVYTGEDTANKGVLEATKKYGAGIGERANQRQTYAESASRQKAQLETVALAISQGARTGKWEEAILELRSLGKTFGIPTGDLSKGELIRTISNEMALRLRNPESGLGLTGNTSNRDLQFLKDSVVGLNRTEEGNIEIIKMLNKFNDLRIDVAAEQNRIIMKNGGKVPLDMDQQLMEYVNDYDFFTDEERERIESMLGKAEDEPDGFGDLTQEEIDELLQLRKQQE